MAGNQTDIQNISLPERVPILGIGVHPVDMETTLKVIGAWIDKKEKQYICLTPIHAILDSYSQPYLNQIYNQSGLTTPDGMGVVWILKQMGNRQVSRVYGPDLLMALCKKSEEFGWSHYFYGAAPGIAQKLVNELKAKFPSLQIAGYASPPFRELTPVEEQEMIDAINLAQPEILWVGLGSPKQEQWMYEHREQIHAPVMAGVGAAFDFISGNKPQAPRWVQRMSLEWLFRLLTEPKRLWRRYIRYPWFFVLLIGERLGLLRFP